MKTQHSFLPVKFRHKLFKLHRNIHNFHSTLHTVQECANRGRNTWFPAPRSPSALTRGPHPSAAPTGCRSLGTQERTKWACPAAMATPESTTGKPSPTPARSRPQPRPDPAPAALPLPSQPQWGPRRTQLRPPPTPSPPEPRPTPPGFAPLLARRAAHLHRGLPVSPAPTPGSRRGSGYCRQFKHEDNTSTPQGQSKLSMI